MVRDLDLPAPDTSDSRHFGSRRHCSRVFRLFALFFPFASQVSRELMPRRGWQAMDVPTGWVQVLRGPRPPSQKWPSAKSGSFPVQQRHVGVSSPSSRVVKAPPSRVNPEIARETALSKVQEVGAGVVVDVRLPRSCHRRSEARVGEGPECFQETTNRCRSRTMPQVHHEVREEGGRVGCGTFSRIQCSHRSEGSPSTFGGRTSSSNEPPGTINTFVSTSRVCRDCCIEGQTRRRETRCDPESVEQAAGDHVLCGKCKRRSADASDQSSQRVARVVAGVPRRSWDKLRLRETRPE